MEQTEALLQMPYWVIDILPEQVPADGGGQYFAVEDYYLREPRRRQLRQKQLDLLLKLNCYMEFRLPEGQTNPAPELLAEAFGRERMLLRMGDALLVAEPEYTYMTVYHPDDRLLRLLRTLAAAEGLFVWQPPAVAEEPMEV